MVVGEMRTLCVKIVVKNKNSDKKRNKQLKELKKFVSNSDLFKGKKRRINKIINSFMK